MIRRLTSLWVESGSSRERAMYHLKPLTTRKEYQKPAKRSRYDSIPDLEDDRLSSDGDSDIEPDLPAGMEGAALASRLPPDRLSKQEQQFFGDITGGNQQMLAEYLFIRNKILHAWLQNPKDELTLEKAQHAVNMPHPNKGVGLVMRVHGYLQRFGYINFGVFQIHKNLQGKMPFKVVIVGAGMAGLTAARQLTYFGLDVTVVEARGRVGGRIHTFKKDNFVADLGAMVITGLGGNPLAVLRKQLSLNMSRIHQRCPLYLTTGEMVSKEKDKTVEVEFNHLLDSSSHLAHHLQVDHVEGKPLSLGQALDIIIQLQEEHVRSQLKDHLLGIVKLQEEKAELVAKVADVRAQIREAHTKQQRVSAALSVHDNQPTALAPVGDRELTRQFRLYDDLVDHLHELEVKLDRLQDSKPPNVYMSAIDRQLVDWHFANLEFANAAPLPSLSLKHWDQDDDFELTGAHLAMRDGYCRLPELLAEGLDIRHGNAVNTIKYTQEGVEVHSTSTDTGSSQIFRGDVVLVTVPLGVLKGGKISFQPALPEWKKQAIRNLGFGLLNKVVLCFEERFWDSSVHLFGHVATSHTARGEFFLFWHLSETPVLIALVAGEDAERFESLPDHVVLAKALAVLRSIFGDKAVPEPQHYYVTRWRSDEYTCGSYSYVAAGATGNDYDFLAAPLCPASHGVGVTQSRVFFAGEHTMKNYPATVHGAMLSGLREAGRIGDTLLGAPYTPRPSAGDSAQVSSLEPPL